MRNAEHNVGSKRKCKAMIMVYEKPGQFFLEVLPAYARMGRGLGQRWPQRKLSASHSGLHGTGPFYAFCGFGISKHDASGPLCLEQSSQVILLHSWG